jgi:hypothetical protein
MWKPRVFTRLPVVRRAFLAQKQMVDALYAFFDRQIDAHRALLHLTDHDQEEEHDEEQERRPVASDYVGAFLRQQHKLERAGETEHTFTYNLRI